MAKRYRQTARLILVSPQGRALLLCWHDPGDPDTPHWGTIGGGIEPGETAQDAAVRELWEETGIAVPAVDVGEPFFQGRHTHQRNGIEIVAVSKFFALSIAGEPDVHPMALDPSEVLTDSRWWRPAELTGVRLSNPHLPEIVAQAVSLSVPRLPDLPGGGPW